ncbi:DNA-binding transcriptional LysR family regulator [Ochrobactrum sp. P6BSIII]|nr:DNA-binding transcriptional LysR family regulator [Ochrobactrum sp. P6BSIII]
MDIDLGVTDRAVNLLEDGVDCVLCVGPLNDLGPIARPIGKLAPINVASHAHLKRYGAPQSPSDLGSPWAVNYAFPSSGRVDDWEWIEDGKQRTLPVRGRVTVNSAEAYIACCLSGLGLIQIPAYDVRRHLEAEKLVEVMLNHRTEPMPITLLYPHRQHLSRRLQVFADWLEALLKSDVLCFPRVSSLFPHIPTNASQCCQAVLRTWHCRLKLAPSDFAKVRFVAFRDGWEQLRRRSETVIEIFLAP